MLSHYDILFMHISTKNAIQPSRSIQSSNHSSRTDFASLLNQSSAITTTTDYLTDVVEHGKNIHHQLAQLSTGKALNTSDLLALQIQTQNYSLSINTIANATQHTINALRQIMSMQV